MGTTYYSQQELQKDARALAARNHCAECEEPMRLVRWEIGINGCEATLVALIACGTHDYRAFVRMHL